MHSDKFGAPNAPDPEDAAPKAATPHELKIKMISSLSPLEAHAPIHSELKTTEKLCYDQRQRKYISSEVEQILSVPEQEAMTSLEKENIADSVLLSFYDEKGQLVEQANVSDIINPKVGIDAENSSSSGKGSVRAPAGSQVESKLQNPPSVWSFEDNMSILRFKTAVSGPQKQSAIAISNCGFEITVIKQKQKSKNDAKEKQLEVNRQQEHEQQLVLTNMTFSSGVHFWEIICPISCQDIHVGAYNPVSQKEMMESFYTTTPRSIFVCLDLNHGQIKFWLNEHKIQHKILSIGHTPGQQWIPSIKIGRERNKAILNPYPYIPLDFIESSSERNFDFSKLLIPHLFNTICVTGLPKVSTESKQAVDQLKNLLHLSNNQLSKITLFKTQGNRPLPDNEMLCFLKFHNYEMMQDFIDYHRTHSNDFSGYKSSGYRSATRADKTDDDLAAKKRTVSGSNSNENEGGNKKKQDSPAKSEPREAVTNNDKKEESASKPEDERKTSEEIAHLKKSGHKVEFKLDSEGEKDEQKITILEPQEIIALLMLLDRQDKDSQEKIEALKTPLRLIKNEMKISEAQSLAEVKESIESAYKILMELPEKKNTDGKYHSQSQLKVVQQAFTDKLICVKDSYYLKLIHRDQASQDFQLGQQACFSDPPRTLESRVTLQILYQFVPSLFQFMSWQSMFKENKEHLHYLGFIKKVFDDMQKKCKFISVSQGQKFIQFQVKLFDMKYFLESAKQHVLLAIKKQSQDWQDQTDKIPDRQAEWLGQKFDFQPSQIPNLDDFNTVLNILVDLEEQIWVQTRSSQCPSDVKNFMNSVSRPYSAYNRLGSFVAWGISALEDSHDSFLLSGEKDSPILLAEMGYILKKSHQITHAKPGNSRAQISFLNYASLKESQNLQKYFGEHNRMLNGYLTDNIQLSKSLNYQVPSVSGQQILDIIPSPNSEFSLISKPNGVVQLYSCSINLSDVKQIIMFSNDGDKIQNMYNQDLKKLKSKEQGQIKQHESVMEVSPEIKFVAQNGSIDKSKKKTKAKEKEAGLAKSGTGKKKKAKNIASFVEPTDPSDGFGAENEEAGLTMSIKKHKHKKQYKEDDAKFDLIMEADELEENDAKGATHQPSQPEAKKPELDEKKKESKEAPKEVEQQSRTPVYQKFDVQQCEIYGYFFLTQPAHVKALDPIVVGCIFKNLLNNKTFIRVKKLAYKFNYLTQFIEVDPDTGFFVNKLTNSQMTFGDKSKKSNILEILKQIVAQHQEQIVDMNAIFLRNLASKLSKSKFDSRFQIFQEICEADIEIADCEKLIDFTRCSYSISRQDSVHVLTSNKGELSLKQFTIVEDGSDIDSSFPNAPKKINIVKKQELIIEPRISRSIQKVFEVEDKVLLVDETCAFVFHQSDLSCSNGVNYERIELHATPIMKTLSVVNKTPRTKLYCKDNICSTNEQEWHLTFRTSEQGRLESRKLTNSSSSERRNQEDEFNVQLLSQDQLNMIIKEHQPRPLPFSCNANHDARIHLQGFGTSNDNQTLTLLQNVSQKQAQSGSLEIQMALADDVEVVSLRVTCNLKKSGNGEFTEALFSPRKTFEPADVSLLATQPRPLPLTLEQLKGAQTNDKFQPSIITNNCQTVFCSNYAQPEFIFKHQHHQKFIMTSFTVRSLFNRDGQGMPIGKGYIFASDYLEDIVNTKKFVNRLQLTKQEWQPKQKYLATEPIGSFDLDKTQGVTIAIDKKFQRPFRFVKLVPVGFRKGPINFARTKFHSKQAEIQFFGINGYEIANQTSADDSSTGHTDELNKVVTISSLLSFGGSQIEAKEKVVALNQLYNSSTTTTPECEAILKKERINQYQPIFKADQVFELPAGARSVSNTLGLNIDLDGLKTQGFSISAMKLRIIGKTPSKLISSEILENKDGKFYSEIFKPIFDNIKCDSIGIYHLRLVHTIFKQWKATNQEALKEFLMKHLSIGFIKDFFENSLLEIHKIEQMEVLQIFFCLIDPTEVKSKETIFNQFFQEMVFEFVSKQIKRFLVENTQKSKIINVLKLGVSYLSAKKLDDIQQILISTVSEDICLKQFTNGADDFAAQIDLKHEYGIFKSVLDGSLMPLAKVRQETAKGQLSRYRANLLLDQENVGQSLLITKNLTEVYKVNNLYHFNVDFQSPFRVNKLKLIFDEKSKKQLSFKMRVNISIPEYSHLAEEDAGSMSIKDQPRLKLIHTQLFDENQIYHINQLAFKKSCKKYFKEASQLHRITINLDDTVHDGYGGFVTRHMTVQIQLLETMKSTKESQIMSNSCLMFPQFYGFESSEVLPQFDLLKIRIPVKKQSTKRLIGLDNKIIYKVYDIEGQSNKKCALFVHQDDSNGSFESEEEYNKVKKELKDNRAQIRNLVSTKGDKRKISACAEAIHQIKLKNPIHFNMDKDINYSYLLTLCEILSDEILTIQKMQKESPEFVPDEEAKTKRQRDIKALFYNLFDCFIIGESELQKNKGHFMQHSKALIEFIISNFEDKIEFAEEILDQYIFNPRHDLSEDEQSKILKFLVSHVSIKINDLLRQMSSYFDCAPINRSSESIEEEIAQSLRQFEPARERRNKKQKLSSIKKLIKMIQDMVDIQSQETKSSSQGQLGQHEPVSIDVGAFLHLITDHLIFCPKIKFKATCPDNGVHHAHSIDSTNELIQQAIETLCSLLANPGVHTVLDLSEHREDVLRLLVAMNLTDKQGLFFDLFLSFTKKEQGGVIISLVDSMIRFLRTEGDNFHFNKSLKKDILHLLKCNLMILSNQRAMKSKTPEMEVKLDESIAIATKIGEDILADAVDDLERQKQEDGYQAKCSEMWQNVFQIILQLELLKPDEVQSEPQSLLSRLHKVFFNLDKCHRLEHLQAESQGLQLMLVPKFLHQVQKEIIGSQKQGNLQPTKVISICLQILDDILNVEAVAQPGWEFSRIQYSFASGILGLLQSAGECLQAVQVDIKEKEHLDQDSFIDKIRESRASFKLKFSEKQMLKLCHVSMKFISKKLYSRNFEGIAGGSLELISKLDVANLLVQMIEYATSPAQGQEATKLRVNSFQRMVFSSQIEDVEKQEIFSQIFDWLLNQYMLATPTKQLSFKKQKLLKASLLSILVQCLPCSSLYDIDRSEATWMTGLDVALKCLLSKIQSVDKQIQEHVAKGQINQYKALLLQKNSNDILMMMFQNWIVTDATAQNFLRNHDGFNFILKRLFQEKDDQKSSEDDADEFLHEEISSDESGAKDSDQEDAKLQFTISRKSTGQLLDKKNIQQPVLKKQGGMQESAKATSPHECWAKPMKAGKNSKDMMIQESSAVDLSQAKQHSSHVKSAKELADIQTMIKEQDFAEFAKIVHASDEKASYSKDETNLGKHKKNPHNDRRIIQVTLAHDPALEQEFSFVVEIQKPLIQLSELQISIFNKDEGSQGDLQSYLPLIVMAEGGSGHQGGQIQDTSFAVPLKLSDDHRFQFQQQAVFGHHFEQGQGTTIPSVKFIKFTLQHPVTSILDQSWFYNYLQSGKRYGVSFISIIGSQRSESPIQEVLSDIQKESALQMLSQFFKGQFSNTFKSIAQEPEIVQKIKEVLSRIGILLETKQELIKPIFISLCQDNDELCNWVVEEKLLHPNFEKLTPATVEFLGELVMAIKSESGFLTKLELIRNYIFDQITMIGAGFSEVSIKSSQIILHKLMGIYVKSIKRFQHKFADAREPKELKIGELEIQDLLVYIGCQKQAFKDDLHFCQRISKSALKLLMLFLQPPSPFFSNSCTTKGVCKLIIDRQIDEIGSKGPVFRILKLTDLDILTIFAANDAEVYHQLQRNEELGKVFKVESIDLVQSMVDELLDHNQIMENPKQKMASNFDLSQNVYNLCKNSSFRIKYAQQLPLELYQRTIKRQRDKLTLNPELNEETINSLLQIIQELTLSSHDRDQTSLNAMTRQLKQDLNCRSTLADVDFIKKIIIPILHFERKVPFKLSLRDCDQLNPIFVADLKNEGAEHNLKEEYFIDSTILDGKMKQTLKVKMVEMRQDKMPLVAKMVQSKWNRIYFQEKDANTEAKAAWNASHWDKFTNAIKGKSKLMFIFKGTNLSGNTSDFKSWGYSENFIEGVYCHSKLPSQIDKNMNADEDMYIDIDYHENNFAFIYNGDDHIHFQPKDFTYGGCEWYIMPDTYGQGGHISFYSSFAQISMTPGYDHQFGYLEYLQSIEDFPCQKRSFAPDLLAIEVWEYEQDAELIQDKMNQTLKKELKKKLTFNKKSPLNFFSENLIFEECANKQLSQIRREFQEQFAQVDQSIFFVESANEEMTLASIYEQSNEEVLEIEIGSQARDAKGASASLIHKAQFPILQLFEQQKGICDIIHVALSIVQTYKDQKQKHVWTLWLEEIKSFCELPQFFEYFSQDYENCSSIYKLIDSKYDIKEPMAEESKQIEERLNNEYIKNVQYTYKIIGEVFRNHAGSALSELCIHNGTFVKFFDRLSLLTGEKARIKSPQGGEVAHDEQISMTTKSDTTKKVVNISNKPSKEKKGVGYTTGSGSIWNVQEYLASKELRSSQITTIIEILLHSIKSSDSREFADLVLESSLLPILEAALRSGSLLEMAKETSLYDAYLDLMAEMSTHPQFSLMVMDISSRYVPVQKQSIADLLWKLADQSKIFMNCLNMKDIQSEDSDEAERKLHLTQKLLAEKIIETHMKVQSTVAAYKKEQLQQEIQNLAKMPIEEAYHQVLSPMRFDYMAITATNHQYYSNSEDDPNPSQSKIIRLAQEIADLSISLPCDPTNALFCRVDSQRVDLMKVMIMGAQGTPYAHGAFIYDLYFPANYPNSPPQCILKTTGGGEVRFNPNLYECGKVCLSLLGTWRGSSTENWDPKLSTILQLLLSIQAIIMSNEVYFNEPGYEHEMNTDEGEKKNNGYANIVKYCNIKYAMIEVIKNPISGFESVINKSFYLKKEMILEEVKQWCEEAKDDATARYYDLVTDHNYAWASKFEKPGAFNQMMQDIYQELEETLNSIKNPFLEEKPAVDQKEKSSFEAEESMKIQAKFHNEDLEQVDVSYGNEPYKKPQGIDIENEQVKDRWSRYIGAMGIEAVAKQAESRILVCELGALGVEIAKNIVLAGCKELVIFEKHIKLTKLDIELERASGQFLLAEEELEIESIALACKHKLQELNHYVKVSVHRSQPDKTLLDYLKHEKLQGKEPFKAVVMTKQSSKLDKGEVMEVDSYCRGEGIPFIQAFVQGCSARIMTDFGEQFKVLEQNSEEIAEVMIQNISSESGGLTVVKLVEGFKHQFQDKDVIELQEVKGMVLMEDGDQQINSGTSSINSTQHVIKRVIDRSSFELETDISGYSSYESSGLAKHVKVPKIESFKPLKDYFETYDQLFEDFNEGKLKKLSFEMIENAQNEAGYFDESLIWADFEKIREVRLIDFIHAVLSSTDPGMINILDLLLASLEDQHEKEQLYALTFKIIYMLDEASMPSLSALVAFVGGVASQEVVKAVTQKFMPIKQLVYFSCSELIDGIGPFTEAPSCTIEQIYVEKMKKMKSNEASEVDEQHMAVLFGSKELYRRIQDCKLFMVGAGAIGCELLKNYSMLGIGTGKDGHIILTDPDVIEISNLNRQFLFREKHLRKPKSSTAAAAAIQMNHKLQGHISARLDKIHDGTADIYTEEFYAEQTIVTNALDNVQARLYLDNKCVQARVAMIDSGTLGPKGHVQVVKPFETESYASQKDPEAETEIPHCTLKMFPEETLHCVEWAKDLFGNWFTLDAQSCNKFFFTDDHKDFTDSQVKSTALKALKLFEKQPKSFDDCLQKARKKFQSYFFNKISQLIHVYPLDKLTNEGRPFWSLPKRAPQKVEFDPASELHASFVAAYACLSANMYQIDIPQEFTKPRSLPTKLAMAQRAAEFEVKEFVPNDQKAREIENQVATQGKLELDQLSQGPALTKSDDIQSIKMRYSDAKEAIKAAADPLMAGQRPSLCTELVVEEFEKDQDGNYHVDFMYAMANIRAQNYGLAYMDWITVKIKAGRIVPALATTTAAVAGLQTVELLKFLKGLPVQSLRNAFINLAVPSLMMGEPGPAQRFQLCDGLSASLWDRWEFHAATSTTTLADILQYLSITYHGGLLVEKDVLYGSRPLFLHALATLQHPGFEGRSFPELQRPLLDLLSESVSAKVGESRHVNLVVTFTVKGKDAEMLKNVPEVRVYFQK